MWGLTVMAAALALSGCGGSTEDPTPDPTEEPSPTETVIEPSRAAAPEPELPPTWPLTGLPIEEQAERPALAVKIENPREARPQTGLDSADMVWEEVIEGGVTRFVAVFHSTMPAEIGPIRSVRPMDATIAAPLRGLMVFSGGQQAFVTDVRNAGLQVVSHDLGHAGFYRIRGRSAPHNVYGSPEQFLAQATTDHQAAPPVQFPFAVNAALATAAADGVDTSAVNVVMSGYSNPRWTWDAGSGTWLRSEGSSDAVTADGARLAATNVITLRVNLVDTGTRDAAGSAVPETVMVDSGQALVATGGKTIEATWSKTADDEPVTLTTADGQPVLLAPGRTWIELVPNSSGSVTAVP